MADHLESYSSAKLKVLFMDDAKGKEIKKDTLLENLYDFCTSFHDPNKSIFHWYVQKIWALEMSIRRKWNSKVLPLVNIILKKCKEKDEFFDPEKYLEEVDQEKCFELLKAWKVDVEKSYLEEHPHLRFSPIRHEKCLITARRKCIR